MKVMKMFISPILVAIMLVVSFMSIGVFASEAESSESGKDEFDLLREKWKVFLTAEGMEYSLDDPIVAENIRVRNETAADYFSSMNLADDAQYLWEDLSDNSLNQLTTSYVTSNYSRLLYLAVTYETKGAEMYKSEELKNAIIFGLDWMYENRYNENVTPTGNWWDWEVGCANNLNDTVVIMYEHLTDDQIANYMNAIDHFQNPLSYDICSGHYDACNRLFQIRVRLTRGIIVKSVEEIEKCDLGMDVAFKYVKSGNGFYDDGSYLAHGGVAYSGTYGCTQFQYMSYICWLLDGSPWAMNENKVRALHNLAATAIEPFIYNGNLMTMIRGRELARYSSQEIVGGIGMISAFSLVSAMDQTGATLDYASIIKNWMDNSLKTEYPYYEKLSLFALLKSHEVVSGAGEYTYSTDYMHFPKMDKTVVRSDDWAFALSMYSERTMNYEEANGENTRGWHTSDGVTYLYDSDVNRYNDNYWCTVDMYRLPGTTVAYKTTSKGCNVYGVAGKSFAGGAELGDGIGMSVQRVYNENIDAKKAWLVLGDKILNFGAGITTTNDQVGETIVENLKINGDNTLIINGTEKSKDQGWKETLENVSTIWIEGNVDGSDVGYYFPDRTTLSGIREARTGKWSNITSYPGSNNATPYTRNYLTIYQDHGVALDATYAYVTLPGYSAEDVASYGENPSVEIILNNENVQAARDALENITGFVFWNNVGDAVTVETNTVDGLTSYNSAVVIRKETEETVKLAISDFSWRNECVTIDYDLGEGYIVSEIVSKSDNVKVLSLNPIRIKINTENCYGQTSYVTLRKGSSEGVDLPTSSVSSLENYLTVSDYRPEELTEISSIISEGKAALESAENENILRATLVEYMNKLDAVPTDAEMTEEEINACPGVRVYNDDSAVIKSGFWKTYDDTVAAWTLSGSAEFTFTGSVISILGIKTDDSGICDIYIDGNLVETVDPYKELRPYSTGVLFRKTDLPCGEHTIKLVAKNTKNEYSTDYKIWLDSFVYGNIGHKYTSVVTEPSYTSQGYTTHTCICGDTYTDSYVDAIGGDVSYSGTMASGYNWMIVSPGVLVISGSGDGIIAFDSVPTADDLSAIPWIEYAESITEIVIEEATGITGISDYAFAGLPNLTSVILPNSLNDLSSKGLFMGDTALVSITNHGSDAQDGIIDIRNVTNISASVLVGLNGSIWVGKGDGIKIDFTGVNATDQIIFVSYPTCDAADDIRAYIRESGSTTVKLTYYSVEFDPSLARDGAESNTSSYSWTFDEATGLLTLKAVSSSELVMNQNTPAYLSFKKLWRDAIIRIQISGSPLWNKMQINNISEGFFNNLPNLEAVLIDNRVSEVQSTANGLFASCTSLTTVDFGRSWDNVVYNVVDLSGFKTVRQAGTVNNLLNGCASVTNVKLPTATTNNYIASKIGPNEFKNCVSLKFIKIPSGITTVDSTAFEGCSNLFISVETAEIYNTLKNSGLNSVIDLRETAIADISIDLSQITTDITVLLATGKEASFETYSADALNEVFGDFDNVIYYVYPTSNGASVVREMMKDDRNVAIKYYPESIYSELTRSGSSIDGGGNVGFVWSFDDDSGKLTLDFKLKSSRYYSSTKFIASWKPIWADAVYEIYSLGSIDKLLYHGGTHGIFDSYENLWKIWFKDDYFEIQNNSYASYGFFSNNPSLTTLGFGAAEPEEGVVNIAFVHKFTSASCSQNLFNGCKSISAVTFRKGTPINLSAITNGMFANCSSLSTLTLPSYVTSISANAFKGCTSLKNLVLKNSAVKVDATAFNGVDTKIICFDEAQVEAINASLESGETEAKAMLMNGAINAEGISIRYKDYNGLRYIFSFDNVEKKDLASAGFTLREYGILVSSSANMANAFVSSDSNGAYIAPATNIKKVAVYDSTYEENDGYSGKTLSISTAEKTMFAGTVTNFSEDNGKLEVYARAYAVYFDAEGNEYIYYCDYGDVSEEYKAASIFKVAYDMYKANAEGIRDAAVDEKAVWSILLLGADVEEIRETPIEGFENVTITLVNDGEGNYLAFLKSNASVSSEAVAAAKEKLTASGYADVEVLPIVINK
ncbi:MAG: leucine-rich repeat protein [Clostridia bacterium]|nr:leucine-rich repeat protein [Clostridia bacterium]